MEITTLPSDRPTSDEAISLWRAWAEDRDVRARDRLVLSYAPMVKYLAFRKARELPAHCDVDDLVSCGLLALMAAVDRFDPARGSFESFVWTRVSGAMLDELRALDWAPRSLRRAGRGIERARDSFQRRSGRSPADHELADELGTGVDELRACLAGLDRAEVGSLNVVACGQGESALEVIDTLEAPSGMCDPETSALANERSMVVRNAISELSERHQNILHMLYVWEMPGAEVGRVMGISESRVSQIVSSIRTKLRQRLEAYEQRPERNAA